MHRTRRGFLAASAAALTASMAGCIDSLSTADTSDESNAQASFYLLYDLAQNIAADGVTVESIVPFGQHGHGWDGPTAGQQRAILTADLFVYMGDGFQPWADNIVENINQDNADVEVVAARGDIELIDATTQAENHDHVDDEHEDQDDHTHENTEHDPHFWLDPRRTEHAVKTIRDGMITVDPTNQSTYQDRTDEYTAELTALHDEFLTTLSNATKDAVFIAGHNAFRYLGDTYGFDIYSLTGLSPDEGISASARREAQHIIEEHDIEYILHPALEPRAPAEQLVSDTGANAVLEITAISGVTDEWIDNDLGYIELMRTINLPTLTKALEAE
jgi:zinc transport system substrate-binding protein